MPERDALTPAGRRILDMSARLFYDQGIHAVGVDAVAAASGVTKRTLYACFGSKDRLVARYLAERDETWRRWLVGWVERNASPEERLLAVFDALDAWRTEQGSFRGCGFVNALAELPSDDHPARQVIEEQHRWTSDYLVELAAATGARRPEELATTVLLLYEGAGVVAAKGMRDAVRDARRSAAVLVADASRAAR